MPGPEPVPRRAAARTPRSSALPGLRRSFPRFNKGAGRRAGEGRRRSRGREPPAHEVVESPFLGGGERAAAAARGLSPAEGRGGASGSRSRLGNRGERCPPPSATLLRGHFCRRKTLQCLANLVPALPFQVCTGTVLFLAELRGRKIAQVRGVYNRVSKKKIFFFLRIWSGFPYFLKTKQNKQTKKKKTRTTKPTFAHTPAITTPETHPRRPGPAWDSAAAGGRGSPRGMGAGKSMHY